MSGIFIPTRISGLATVTSPFKKDDPICSVRYDLAQMRVFTGGWYNTIKFDPSLVGGDTMQFVLKTPFYFEGTLDKDVYTKKGATKPTYFSYIRVTKIVLGDELEAMMPLLKRESLKAQKAEIDAQLKAMS